MTNHERGMGFAKRKAKVKIEAIQCLAMIFEGLMLAGCQQSIPDRALPVTANLADYELVGNVKKVIHENPQRWSSEDNRFIGTDDGIEVWEFNQAGYLTRRDFADREDEEIIIRGARSYILDNKNRLMKYTFEVHDKLAFEVSYTYKETGNVIDILPVDARTYKGEPKAYSKYRQIFEGNQVELWIDDHNDPDPRKPSQSYLIKNGSRIRGAFGSAELQYSDGRMAVYVYSSGGVSTGRTRKEERYEYEGTTIWPKTHTILFRDGQVVVEHNEYTLDDRGNWIERKTYRIEGGEKRLIGFENRSIEYY